MNRPDPPWYLEYEPVPFDDERAQELIAYLDRYEYASLDHVLIALLWQTDMNVREVRALDVEDIDLADGTLELVHRPGQETPLKQGSDDERSIAIDEDPTTLLADHLQHQHRETTDKYGRNPLLASPHGRYHREAIRYSLAKWTRPCEIGDCPHDCDPDTCEAATDPLRACRCPSSAVPQVFEGAGGEQDE